MFFSQFRYLSEANAFCVGCLQHDKLGVKGFAASLSRVSGLADSPSSSDKSEQVSDESEQALEGGTCLLIMNECSEWSG